MAHQPLVGYWEFLALATGLVCIVTEWPKLDDRQARLRLIWRQSVHWVAVLVAMNIMLLSGVQQFVPAPATSLVLLLLLALGTFLAGLNLSLLPICFFGSSARLGSSRYLMAQTVRLVLGANRGLFGWGCNDVVAKTIRANGNFGNRQQAARAVSCCGTESKSRIEMPP
jgi:hypothetical protein